MEELKDRVVCKFEGYTADGNMLMVDSYSHYRIFQSSSCTGISILSVGKKYQLRVLPGNRYHIDCEV